LALHGTFALSLDNTPAILPTDSFSKKCLNGVRLDFPTPIVFMGFPFLKIPPAIVLTAEDAEASRHDSGRVVCFVSAVSPI
jgi:hypothetical protein